MESMKGAASFRNSGKQSFLPPKSPFPSIATSGNLDFGASGSKEALRSRDGQRQHQRTSSESFLIEEQPCWLDDLLNEPETPVKRGTHRRSSSDSFAYMDGTRAYSNFDSLAKEEIRQKAIMPTPMWGSQDFDIFRDFQHHVEGNSLGRQQNRLWVSGHNMGSCSNNLSTAKDKGIYPWVSGVKIRESEVLSYSSRKKLEQEIPNILQSGSEKKDASQAKISHIETDSMRVKQQFAQRSRVRKLQYISELERNVQALQAEGVEVSAELEFVDQQNLMLSLENKALKQRLDGLTQEQLVKHLQQEMLEREVARLRLVLQQQHQHHLPSHGRNSSIKGLNSQLANISLKHKEKNSGRDPVTGLHIQQ